MTIAQTVRGQLELLIAVHDYVFSALIFQRPYICISRSGCDLSNNGIVLQYLNFEISTVSHENLESDITGLKASSSKARYKIEHSRRQ